MKMPSLPCSIPLPSSTSLSSETTALSHWLKVMKAMYIRTQEFVGLINSYPQLSIYMQLVSCHTLNKYNFLNSESSSSPTASSMERVVLVKTQRAGLGLLIHESPDQSGVYVQEVVENQAAFLDGRIQAGDKILAINHNNTVGASQDTVFKLLQACQGKVVLTVQHRDTFSPATSTIDFSESEQSQHFTQPPPPPPGVKFPFGGPLPIPTRDPPPYSSSSFLPDPQTGVHPAMWSPLQERHTQPSPPPPIMHRSGEGKSVCLSIYLSICLSVYLISYLSVCLSI